MRRKHKAPGNGECPLTQREGPTVTCTGGWQDPQGLILGQGVGRSRIESQEGSIDSGKCAKSDKIKLEGENAKS